MPAALALERVSKRYARSGPWALEGVTLEVSQGAVLVLLGPNGSGKTTLLKLALGVLFPTEGRVSVLGMEDLETARSRIGYMPQRADYYSDFTAREHLRWLGLIGGGSGAALEQQVEQLLGRMGLAEHAEGRLATYSPGLLQRVGLAQVLLSDPEVLLLDEPVASLDPDGQTDFEALIHEWRTQGKTCVITSNNLDEAARIATHIGILKDGLLADFREWSTEELVHTFSLSVPPLSPEVQQALAEWDVTYHAEAGELLVTSPSDHVPPALLRTLLDHDVTPRAVTPQGPSLPEVYHSALQSSDE